MNRIYLKLNWPSKVIALVAFLGFTSIQGHAQTVIINDDFSNGYNGLGGSTPDITNTPGNQWVGSMNRGITANWSPTGDAAVDFSGNGVYAAGISFAGYGSDIDTLTVNAFKSTTAAAGSPILFGFNTASSLSNGLVGEGYTDYINSGFICGSGGLGVALYQDGSGDLWQNGGIVASWTSPFEFNPGQANVLSLSYNDVTDLATVSEEGDTLASFNAGSISLNSAAIGGFYTEGWANGDPNPDGFASFSVSTQAVAAAPGPSPWALMFSGVVGLFFFRRLRSASRS